MNFVLSNVGSLARSRARVARPSVTAHTWCQNAVYGADALIRSGPGAGGGAFTLVNSIETLLALLMPSNPATFTFVLAGCSVMNASIAAEGFTEFM
jgi:hypothetical protein